MVDKKLEKLMEKGNKFLGTKYPIMCGAMAWVSDYHLASAVSNAGGFGVIASGSMPLDMLSTEIDNMQKATKKPFGVNLMTMHPDHLKLVDLCVAKKVSHVIIGGALPSAEAIEKLKAGNVKVMCFAPAHSLAKRLIKKGVDALIIEGHEAGGHIGPVATTVLLQEVMFEVKDEVPVFVAGGIGHGKMIRKMLELGAAGVQMGTAFVCAEECTAHENFKKAFIRASSKDAIPTFQIDPKFPVIPVRAIKNQATTDFMNVQREAIEKYKSGTLSYEDAFMEIEKFWLGSLRRAVKEGDVETGSVMAGQSVGLVKKIEPAKDIISRLVEQMEEAE